MVQFNYQGLALRADKIMKQFGRSPGTSYLRRNGVDREVTALEHDFSARERDGNLVQEADIRYLVASFSPDGALINPPPDDRVDEFVILENGVESIYQMVGPPKRTQPGPINVFWQLHLRPR